MRLLEHRLVIQNCSHESRLFLEKNVALVILLLNLDLVILVENVALVILVENVALLIEKGSLVMEHRVLLIAKYGVVYYFERLAMGNDGSVMWNHVLVPEYCVVNRFHRLTVLLPFYQAAQVTASGNPEAKIHSAEHSIFSY